EEQALAVKPTSNPEGYDAYLRGLAYSFKTENTAANALEAQKHLREAVRLDPNFALAWALLSYVESRGYLVETLQPTLALREEQALAVKPTSNPEGYDAYLRGLAYSFKTENTAANALEAQKHLREAVRLDPNFALAWALLSYVESRGYLVETLQPTLALREE